MKKLRYGIIGCGSMGREHIENLRAMGGAAVTAIADPSPPEPRAGGRHRRRQGRSSSTTTGIC